MQNKLQQNLWVNDIKCLPRVGIRCTDGELTNIRDPRHRHVELAMTKYRAAQIDAKHIKRLALGSVDCHRKAKINGKLMAFDDVWQFILVRRCVNTGN